MRVRAAFEAMEQHDNGGICGGGVAVQPIQVPEVTVGRFDPLAAERHDRTLQPVGPDGLRVSSGEPARRAIRSRSGGVRVAAVAEPALSTMAVARRPISGSKFFECFIRAFSPETVRRQSPESEIQCVFERKATVSATPTRVDADTMATSR